MVRSGLLALTFLNPRYIRAGCFSVPLTTLGSVLTGRGHMRNVELLFLGLLMLFVGLSSHSFFPYGNTYCQAALDIWHFILPRVGAKV